MAMSNIRDARPKIPPAPADASAVCINPAKGNIRAVDFSLFPENKFCGQMLYMSEGVAIFLTRTPGHKRAGQAHTHRIDQFYYLLEGQLKAEMGTELHSLRPGSVAYIPAGTPHQNWNDGDVPELHLEIMVPGFMMGGAVAEMIDENGVWAPGGSVVDLPERQADGVGVFAYSDPSGAYKPALPESKNAVILLDRREPSRGDGAAEPMRIHKFDQYLYVTQGALQLDLALDRHELAPHTLAIIPAGVPHRSRAIGPTPEAHILVSVPLPPPLAGETPLSQFAGTAVSFGPKTAG